MSIQKVKTAVIGCGMISSIYIRNLSKMFSVIDLVAVCDVRKEAAEARAKEFGIAIRRRLKRRKPQETKRMKPVSRIQPSERNSTSLNGS